HKNLSLRLCSYINLFSCQISSYGLLSLRRLSGYELVHGFRVLPLAAAAQRKMALNHGCSPDLLNVRRQNPIRDGVQRQAAFYSRATQPAAVPSRLARAIRRSPSLTLFRSLQIPVRYLVELTGIEPVRSEEHTSEL